MVSTFSLDGSNVKGKKNVLLKNIGCFVQSMCKLNKGKIRGMTNKYQLTKYLLTLFILLTIKVIKHRNYISIV